MNEEAFDLLDTVVLYLSELDDDSAEGVELVARVIALRTDLMEVLGMFDEPSDA